MPFIRSLKFVIQININLMTGRNKNIENALKYLDFLRILKIHMKTLKISR